MKRSILWLAGWLACVPLMAQKPGYILHTLDTIPYAIVQKGFVNPPAESRLRCYWWWLNSMATKESITRDLEQMQANGEKKITRRSASGRAGEMGDGFLTRRGQPTRSAFSCKLPFGPARRLARKAYCGVPH